MELILHTAQIPDMSTSNKTHYPLDGGDAAFGIILPLGKRQACLSK